MANSSTIISESLCDRYVIFLDIDGVLLPVPKFTFGGGELSRECVSRLATIVATLGGPSQVSIVLSSTWRNHREMIAKLNRFFEETEGAVPPVADGTPNGTVIVSDVAYYADDPTEQRLVRDRVDEIMRWLHVNVVTHPEAVGGRWIAIDDMDLGVDPRMTGHFLKTETDTGLTDEQVAAVARIITGHATGAEAYARAQAARLDPDLKDEEIVILTVQRDRAERKLAELEAALATAHANNATLQQRLREQERLLKENAGRMEDMSYRLALQECGRKSAVVGEALKVCARLPPGPVHKELDARIRSFVNLCRERKELEKKVRAETKRNKARHLDAQNC